MIDQSDKLRWWGDMVAVIGGYGAFVAFILAMFETSQTIALLGGVSVLLIFVGAVWEDFQ